MRTVEDDRSIQETRAELARWGNFWRNNNGSVGSVSLTACFIQSQKSATKYHRKLAFYTAEAKATYSPNVKQVDDVFVPWSLQEIDELIESMQIECKLALKAKYIDRTGLRGVWVDRAERIILFSL
jgi:hypothetical protein